MELASVKSVLESYPGLAIISDRAGRLVYANDTSHHLIHKTNSGTPEGLQLISGLVAEFALHLERLCLTGSENCELLVSDASISSELIQVIGYRQTLANGDEVFVSQFSDHISTQSDALGRRNRTLIAINEVTERMIKHQSLDELLEMVAERLIDLTNASAAFIHLVRPDLDQLEMVVSVGQAIAPIGQTLKRGEGLAGMAWECATTRYIDDYRKLPARLKNISNIKQACALPMVSGGTVQGVLGMMFTDDVESIADQVDLLQQFANLTNVAIQNARLIEDTRIELKQTQALTEITEKIMVCESIPTLLDVAARNIINHYGISAVEAWGMNNNCIDRAIGVWERREEDSAIFSAKPLDEQQEYLNDWLKSKSVLIRSLPKMGFASMPFFEIASFAEHGYSSIVLLDQGKAWALLRLKCEGALPPADRTQHLLFSVVSHLSTAARLLRLLDQANFRAGHDQLTGLPNRYSFNRELEKCLLLADVSTDSLAVLFIDLDGFKTANDTLGHAEGDRLLVKVADRFRAASNNEIMLARLGGDEFAAFVSDVDRRNCDVIAQQLLDSLQAPFDLKQDAAVGASIGIAFYPEDGTDAKQLVNKADEAMYAAKRGGKHQYRYYSETLEDEAVSADKTNVALRKIG